MQKSVLVFGIMVMAIVLLGCTGQSPGATNQNGSTTGYVLPASNQSGSNLQNTSSAESNTTKTPLPPGYTVSMGDKVWVDYILEVDGKVFDTSNKTVAKNAGIYNQLKAYKPFEFTAAPNMGTIDGFVLAVIGMHINETLTTEVDPAQGYGNYDMKKVIEVPRYYNRSLFETAPRAYLEQNNITLTKGAAFSTEFGTVTVNDLNDENATLFFMSLNTPGFNFTYGRIPQRVISVDKNFTAKIEYVLEENHTYALPNPQGTALVRYKVINKTDDTITLDSNHPLAGKTLRFTITLLDAEPRKTKTGNPNVDIVPTAPTG